MTRKFLGETFSTGTSDHMHATFRVFDTNGNGFIQLEELKAVMKKLGNKLTDNKLNDMMRKPDTDGDGQISYNEFVAMMNHGLMA